MTALGRALMAAWGDNPRKKTFTAKGWLAQVKVLTHHGRGSWAADRVGLDPSRETVLRWLSYGGPEDQAPSAANQDKIHRAYQLLAGGQWDPAAESRQYPIRGVVKTGTDVRDRGTPPHGVFLVDGNEGRWGRIRQGYESGEIDEDKAEEWFTEDVIVEDIGDGSGGGWQFPGASYGV